mmetsp:Transcript_11270/g.33992  ORF Transcript_11270/g.33992 Transcript_11270/m.33992 type:complete len:315 (-) Transcript_11270:123-1067(-)
MKMAQQSAQQKIVMQRGPNSSDKIAKGSAVSAMRPVRGGSVGFVLGSEMPGPAGRFSASSAGKISTEMAIAPRASTRCRFWSLYVSRSHCAVSSNGPTPHMFFSCATKNWASRSSISCLPSGSGSGGASGSSSSSFVFFVFFFFFEDVEPLAEAASSAPPPPPSGAASLVSSWPPSEPPPPPPPPSEPSSDASSSDPLDSSSMSWRSSSVAKPASSARFRRIASLISLKTSTVRFSRYALSSHRYRSSCVEPITSFHLIMSLSQSWMLRRPSSGDANGSSTGIFTLQFHDALPDRQRQWMSVQCFREDPSQNSA